MGVKVAKNQATSVNFSKNAPPKQSSNGGKFARSGHPGAKLKYERHKENTFLLLCPLFDVLITTFSTTMI
jgi:hypothetical protein